MIEPRCRECGIERRDIKSGGSRLCNACKDFSNFRLWSSIKAQREDAAREAKKEWHKKGFEDGLKFLKDEAEKIWKEEAKNFSISIEGDTLVLRAKKIMELQELKHKLAILVKCKKGICAEYSDCEVLHKVYAVMFNTSPERDFPELFTKEQQQKGAVGVKDDKKVYR